MRSTICIVMMAVSASCFGEVLISHNPNVSDGGLNMDPPGAWAKVHVSGNSWINASLSNDRAATPDDGGDWLVGGSDGSGSSAPYENYYYQSFSVAPDTYNISLSGWAKAVASWWSGENWNWVQEAHIELWIDGVRVADMMSSNNTNRNTWQFWTYAGTHAVVGTVEVRLRSVKGNDAYGNGGLGAIWFDSRFDDIRLEVSSASQCTNPSDISSVSPPSVSTPPALGTTLLTISGTNLDAIGSVHLSGAVSVPGTIVSQSSTEITANFDLAGQPLGTYALIGSRTQPCTDAVLGNAFSIACACPPATLATIQSDRGLTGTVHTLRLTGPNVTCLTSVKLRKSRDGGAEIPGTALTPVGNDLEVTFDLANAEGGRYDVVATHPCGLVSPAGGSLNRSFLVYMPALTNPSFEEGWTAPDTKTSLCPPSGGSNPKAKHWDVLRFDASQGGHVRDGDVGLPQCLNGGAGPVRNITGNHFNGIAVNAFNLPTPAFVSFFQTIDASPLLQNGILMSEFNIRAELDFDDFNSSSIGYIRLIGDTEQEGDDSSVSGSGRNPKVLGFAMIPAPQENGFVASPAFNAVIPAGTFWPTSDPALLTIEFRFLIPAPGLGGFWVDNVRSGPFISPGCHAVWADSDGDNDVDMDDFGTFQRCFTGPAGEIPGDIEYCTCFDRSAPSNLIDEYDLVEFRRCVTGPAVPWSAELVPDCAP